MEGRVEKMLEGIRPENVFKFFEEISGIPRGSGNTKAISDYCVRFAERCGLEYHRDEYNNCIIIKEASAGYENSEPVIIQGHLDMVCEKESGCGIDMQKDPIKLVVDGGFITADSTTLGGDDGIAIAMALAVLDDDSLCHPRIEAVFTVDEEIGMLGAAALDVSPLGAKRMLNLDQEEEGIFTVSCAGGNLTKCTLPIKREKTGDSCYRLTVSGGIGGHSGVEIDKGRSNSNVLMGRLLYELSRGGKLGIYSVSGGLKDNAIPILTEAVVSYDGDLSGVVSEMEKVFRSEYRVSDPDISVKAESGDPVFENPSDTESTEKIICMLCCMPGGVQSMSMGIPGLVQTSLNLGILKTDSDSVEATFSIRSSVESEKKLITDRVCLLAGVLGAKYSVSGDYPGWEYSEDSPLRTLLCEVYEEQYGEKPKIEAIHAGVECGVFAGKIPGLDCVSLGPDLEDIHTPRERMSIASVERVWNFLVEVLKRMK